MPAAVPTGTGPHPFAGTAGFRLIREYAHHVTGRARVTARAGDAVPLRGVEGDHSAPGGESVDDPWNPVVQDRGRVAEEGSFDELARARGLFSTLIARQQA